MERRIRRHATRLSQPHEASPGTRFQVGQRVRTIDGVLGRVLEVTESWAPGNTAYQIVLDDGLGGGTYLESQLYPAPEGLGGLHQAPANLPASLAAADGEEMAHTADQDYPEMGTVLHDRPDPAGQITVVGSKQAMLEYTPHVREVLPLHMLSHHGWSPAEVREAMEWPEQANALPRHHDGEHAQFGPPMEHRIPHAHEDVSYSPDEPEWKPSGFSGDDKQHLRDMGIEGRRKTAAYWNKDSHRQYSEEDEHGFSYPQMRTEDWDWEDDPSSSPHCSHCDTHHWPEDGHEPAVQASMDRHRQHEQDLDNGIYDRTRYCGVGCQEGHEDDVRHGISTHHTFSAGEPEWADNPHPLDRDMWQGEYHGQGHAEPSERRNSGYEVRNPAAEGRCHYCRAKLPGRLGSKQAAIEGHGLDPASMAMHGLTGDDAAYMRAVLDHIRRRAPQSEPIDAGDAQTIARSMRGRDRMEQAGYPISKHSQDDRVPRGFSVEIPHNHHLTLVPEEGSWYARIDHWQYPMGPKIEHSIHTPDEHLPHEVGKFLAHPPIQAEMEHQRTEGRRVHEEIRRENGHEAHLMDWDADDDGPEEHNATWCHICQEHHGSEEEAESHDTAHTDWDQVYPHLGPEVHRGITVSLPASVHQLVHGRSAPLAERAHALSEYLKKPVGNSWTTNPEVADHYTAVSGQYGGSGQTHVMLHAATPERHHIETDPEELESRRVLGYDQHEDNEVPLRNGTPLAVHGISWREGEEGSGYTHPLREWEHHRFASPRQHVAAACMSSWDNSGSDKTGVYLRFGHWPDDERSFSPAGGYREDGVSVYDLNKHGDPAIDHGLDRNHEHDEHCDPDCNVPTDLYDNDPKEEMQGRVHRAERNRYHGNDRPSETAHLVRGDMAAIGFDGEPLLHNVRRVGDWIDHRHLFIPGAQPHRLARSPQNEEYEPPEESPGASHQAAAYTEDLDPRNEDYNGDPDLGLYWEQPAQQDWLGEQGISPAQAPMGPVEAALAEEGPWYHGTPDERTWQHSSAYGIHIGTEEAARQALNARIGKPHEGEWDGTREYGKTLLSPYQHSGTERGFSEPRYPTGNADYSNGDKVPMDARPNIFPVRIVGPMTNAPPTAHPDWHANGYMRGQLSRGRAKSGYYYRNIGEDEGSVSAVVPSAAHLERLDRPQHIATTINGTEIDHHGDAPEHGQVPRAANPAAYDERSTEGEGDPTWAHVPVPKDQVDAHFFDPADPNDPHRRVKRATAAWYHGTEAELSPGDLIEPGKYPKSHQPYKGEPDLEPRDHTYFSSRRQYITDHYGPNVYEVEPTGPHTHDSEYKNPKMRRSQHPLRVVKRVSGEWGAVSHQATTINGTEIDGHGDAPEHGREPRASNPESYDQRSTEGVGDPKWSKPLQPQMKETYNGAQVSQYPEGMSAGDGPALEIGAFVASYRDEMSDRWHEFSGRYTPGALHRGIHVRLPEHLHDYVHDETIPREVRANALQQHLADNGGLGMHWTPHLNIAHRSLLNAADKTEPGEDEENPEYNIDDWMEDHYHGDDDEHDYREEDEPRRPTHTDVILHAATGERNRLRNPQMLEQHGIGWAHSKDEDEFPVKPGSPMRLTGISWRQHEPEYPMEPYEHHDFSKPIRHIAKVPWTPHQRNELHDWQAGGPGIAPGDFVPSSQFTNKVPLQPYGESDPMDEQEEPVRQVHAASDRQWAMHMMRDHGWGQSDVDRVTTRGDQVRHVHEGLHELGMASHRHAGGPEDVGDRMRQLNTYAPAWGGHMPGVTGPGGYRPEPDRMERLISSEPATSEDVELARDNRMHPSRLSSHQFAYSALHLAELQKGSADEVYGQLAKDYPRAALDWVHNATWSGPHFVPFSDVDWEGRHTWEAYQQPDRVSHVQGKRQRREQEGRQAKPAVLIQRPGLKDQRIGDGHHRAFGDLLGGLPGVWAWTGHVSHAAGPWDELHGSQFTGEGTRREPGPDGSPKARKAMQAAIESALGSEGSRPQDSAQVASAGPGGEGSRPGDLDEETGTLLKDGPVDRSPRPAPWPLARADVTETGPAMTQGSPKRKIESDVQGAGSIEVSSPQHGAKQSPSKSRSLRKTEKFLLKMFRQASAEPAFRFEFCAAWRDVVAKAKRIRASGGVRITAAKGSIVIGQVRGDHDVYESGLQRYPGRVSSIFAWSCGCPWASFHQDKSLGTRYAGRPCSHVYALQLEAAARTRFGREQLRTDPAIDMPASQVVVKSLPPWGPGGWSQTWTAPSTLVPLASLRKQAAKEDLPYVRPPHDEELFDHLVNHHGFKREEEMYLGPRSQRHWHGSEHQHRISADHQHELPHGEPLENDYPGLFNVDRYADNDFTGGQRGFGFPKRTEPIDPIWPHYSARDGEDFENTRPWDDARDTPYDQQAEIGGVDKEPGSYLTREDLFNSGEVGHYSPDESYGKHLSAQHQAAEFGEPWNVTEETQRAWGMPGEKSRDWDQMKDVNWNETDEFGGLDKNHETRHPARSDIFEHNDLGQHHPRYEYATHLSARRSYSWDEIGEMHPRIYGDPEIHGAEAEGADGEGVGYAAAELAFDRPEEPTEQMAGMHQPSDLEFHRENVYPHHIDYARQEYDDPRVTRAYRGYLNHPQNVPPLVLVHRHGVYQVADGHHRAQAAERANKKVPAYVAYSPHEDEPFSDGSRAPFHGATPSMSRHADQDSPENVNDEIGETSDLLDSIRDQGSLAPAQHAARILIALGEPAEDVALLARTAGMVHLEAGHSVLPNPHTGGDEWYHGSPYRFRDFGSDVPMSGLEYEDDPDDISHWNTHLGHHFTANHETAREFSQGEHSSGGYGKEGPAGNVLHARLHIRNPKVYGSEHDMDQEAYEHEWHSGNHIDRHLDPELKEYHDEGSDVGQEYDYAGDSSHLRSRDEADPRYWAQHRAFHPYATGWLNAHPEKYEIAQRFKQRLESQGHDGIVYGNEFEKKYHGPGSNQAAIIFHDHQAEPTQQHFGPDCLTHEDAVRQQPGRHQPELPLWGHEAAANDPWGDNNYAPHVPPKPYGATSPPERDRDPGSYGPLAGPDPENWGEILDNSVVQSPSIGGTDAALHYADSMAQGEHLAPYLNNPATVNSQEWQESFPYADRANAAGPSTSIEPRDPQGIRMEEMLLPEDLYSTAAGTAQPHLPGAPQLDGALAELHEEPEPALPETTGGDGDPAMGGADAASGDSGDLNAWAARREQYHAFFSPGTISQDRSNDQAGAHVPEPGGYPLDAAATGGGPGMSMHDEDLSPSDVSIQTMGTQQWSGGDYNGGDLAAPEGSAETGGLDDVVARFQRSAAASQYGGGGPAAGPADGDIAKAAQAFLKTAEVLPEHEAQALITEGRGERARNLGLLDLSGTHYESEDEELRRRGVSLDDYDDDVIFA